MPVLSEVTSAVAGPPPRLRIHPSSVLFRTKPQCLVYHQLQPSASSGYHDMVDLMQIPDDWLVDIAPHMFRRVSGQGLPR